MKSAAVRRLRSRLKASLVRISPLKAVCSWGSGILDVQMLKDLGQIVRRSQTSRAPDGTGVSLLSAAHIAPAPRGTLWEARLEHHRPHQSPAVGWSCLYIVSAGAGLAATQCQRPCTGSLWAMSPFAHPPAMLQESTRPSHNQHPGATPHGLREQNTVMASTADICEHLFQSTFGNTDSPKQLEQEPQVGTATLSSHPTCTQETQ